MSDDLESTEPPPAASTVTRLPVEFRHPPGEDAPFLQVVQPYDRATSCTHTFYITGGRVQHVTYRFRDGETEVECSHCGTKLDPMFVLKELAKRESKYNETRRRAAEDMARLAERERTQCDHCGKITKISRAHKR